MRLTDKHEVLDDGICLTCGLPIELAKELDRLNKERIPYSKRCSGCPNRIDPKSKFENFALHQFRTLHTICEDCVKKYKKYK